MLVDFSAPDALPLNLEVAVAAGKPIVIGTTGLGAGHQAAIDEAAKHILVLQAANMSLGVNLLAPGPGGSGWARTGTRDRRDAPSPQGGRALGHGPMLGAAAAEGAASRSTRSATAAATA